MQNEKRIGMFSPHHNVEKRIRVGGNVCDACGKTYAELGMKQLKKCTRCMNAFYCSVECQRTQWRAGHKEACRKPGQIEPGDLMKLVKLQRRSDLNGLIVETVTALSDRDGNRWKVDLGNQRMFDVNVCNLEHIRPEK
uniref:MYND-type domain-containing protein n=1 Tax=Leptocylindrus danicus TaxID=163516 RepID=A0A7S2PP54_9STRA|mmetsp:Transcript_6528/g.9642  ORF Transcript_6528/g.9642 Transcript_6528/m.9642 type:complete len:138 (+) Transcript_6528:588-1001(+)